MRPRPKSRLQRYPFASTLLVSRVFKTRVLAAVLRIRLDDQVRVHPEIMQLPSLAWEWFKGRMLGRECPAWLQQAFLIPFETMLT